MRYLTLCLLMWSSLSIASSEDAKFEDQIQRLIKVSQELEQTVNKLEEKMSVGRDVILIIRSTPNEDINVNVTISRKQ